MTRVQMCFVLFYSLLALNAQGDSQTKLCSQQPQVTIRNAVVKKHGIQLSWKIVNPGNTRIFVYSPFLESRRAAAWIKRKDGILEIRTSLPSKLNMTAYGYPEAKFVQIEPHGALEGVFVDPDPTVRIARSTQLIFFIAHGDDVEGVKEALHQHYLHGAGHPANPIVDWQCVAASNIVEVH